MGCFFDPQSCSWFIGPSCPPPSHQIHQTPTNAQPGMHQPLIYTLLIHLWNYLNSYLRGQKIQSTYMYIYTYISLSVRVCVCLCVWLKHTSIIDWYHHDVYICDSSCFRCDIWRKINCYPKLNKCRSPGPPNLQVHLFQAMASCSLHRARVSMTPGTGTEFSIGENRGPKWEDHGF